MGKYIRHFLAAVIGALVAATVQFVGTRWGVTFEDEQVRTFTDAMVNAFFPLVLVLWYAWSEKFLKRFPWLDQEGAADRAHRQQVAAVHAEQAQAGRGGPPVV